MSEIHPTDCESIQAHLFPDDCFCEAICELVESESDLQGGLKDSGWDTSQKY